MGFSFEEKLQQFSISLFKIKAVSEKLNVNLRVLASQPKVLATLADLIIEYVTNQPEPFDLICGVPYAAMPIATAVSVKQNIPMVMRRKEAKSYGTKKLIEGIFNEGDKCLILEDTILSGGNVLETVNDLRNSGIECKHVLVVLNQEKSGSETLQKNGLKVHSLLSLSQLTKYLEEAGCIAGNAQKLSGSGINRLTVSYEERAKLATNSVAKKLFELMETKKTNLCVAADVTTGEELLALADKVGPHICLFKTHTDVYSDFSADLIVNLNKAADKHNFILFEDKKFCDVGEKLKLQYTQSIYNIASWATIVTAHSLMGDDVLRIIKENQGCDDRGVFLLAEASSAGNLIDENYTKATIDLGAKYNELITGLVCQSPLFLDYYGWIQLTPGVQLAAAGDSLQQQYDTPKNAVLNRGADIVVVGRGITLSKDPEKEALKYKEASWNAYQERLIS